MSYKKDTIEITLTSYGMLDVVSIPVKLYRDSYKVVKIRVNAPIKSNSMIKMYQSDRNEAGEQIWNSATFDIPELYPSKTITINGADYRVYEVIMPQEICANNGDVNLTFAQVVTTSGEEEIVTSGTLNLYIGGEGFNYAGVQISEQDVLASRLNEVIENAVDKSEFENKVNELASKEELGLVDEKIGIVDKKVDAIVVPTKVSELENDSLFASKRYENTWISSQNFNRPITIKTWDSYPYVNIGNTKYKDTNSNIELPVIDVSTSNGDTLHLSLPAESGKLALTKNHYTKDETDELLKNVDLNVDSAIQSAIQNTWEASY